MDTPQLVIHHDKLMLNIRDMADFARQQNVKLRPHIKAHKIPQIAKKQIETGAVGITASKISEAEIMLEAGITDIFIAYQIVGKEKIRRLTNLVKNAQVTVAVDSFEGAKVLSEEMKRENLHINILVEVDSGLKRCGLPPKEAVNLIKEIIKLPNIIFKGVFTHAGHVYAAASRDEVRKAAKDEVEAVLQCATSLRQEGIEVEVVSIGSTPTAKIGGLVTGITEIRPGNYVFYDAIQVGLGVVDQEKCSLSVITTVISTPSSDRLVIDAGSKTFALDKGAHGTQIVNGFGIIKNYPHLKLERLSEEHGIISVEGNGPIPKIGDLLEIIPNHACTAINLADEVVVYNEVAVIDKWKVRARGKVK